ncbi:translational GTPase TypA [Tepidibacter formicigenes]|jgi:GTP-binding protein|uniref:Large ribosomal subunit assembly factor BipA n=1 Tax=Tepidibacter formicigenes DSM 15518 TaxID=1123349 RepID=A0A1M6LAZ3_9FIRM|nr:translational GTPase TypA [Tepidibacter formicigenes]SHJ68367.1 GTP-binding protein [Tepidibacter formicigenes DSM 15518]
MSKKQEIINIAVIAHVDAGKSTLVDAFLSQSGVFRENQEIVDCVMDSNDLERERGITIYSKNCSIQYNGVKINIVDTPGHSDFSSEVERVIKTVDTVILLVDSSEGPMPQTRFVLQKSLELGIRPILFINKIDKKDQRAEEVVDMVFDLFVDLNATDEQLDFPIIYGIAKDGIAKKELEDESTDLSPLFETILNHVDVYPDYDNDPLQMQVSALAYDDYIGRLGIGRIYKGTLKDGQSISISKRDGSIIKGKISKLFVYEGLKQVPKKEAKSGDIVVIAGISDISIGETVCNEDNVIPMEMIKIEEPTLSMNFLVNDSPFVGQSGKFLTTRHLKDRLEKELEVNIGLKVEPLDTTDGYKVSGRGELHLSILIENMRREGYELSVSKPEVLMHKENGKLLEPVERVIINIPDEYSGTVISKLNLRKGLMESMESENNYTKLEYIVPTRGLIGYRSEFINDTRGEGTIVRSFERFEEYKGEIPQRLNGVLISQSKGTAMGYSLFNLSERATMFINPGTEVYEGMIIGMNSRKEDMVVNPCKNKKLTNTRASGSDDAIKLSPPRTFTLEEALEFIDDDELVEITPDSIRLRKKILNENDRVKYNKKRK